MSTIDSPERGAARLDGAAPRILVVQAPYYAEVVAGMRRGAERVFADVQAKLDVVDVAGAFELPAALRVALRAPERRWDGFLVLGCVVKGETDHYDFLCQGVFAGIMQLTVETGAAVGFGLLTVDNLAQAEARSADDRHNKGAEAAHALIGQMALRRRWGVI